MSNSTPLVVKAPEQNITVIEGWNNGEIADTLQSKNLISPKDFAALEKSFDVSAYPVLASKPKSADLEGFLFPDTYTVFSPSADLATNTAGSLIIKKMLDNFSQKFTAQMLADTQNQGKTVYQIIILASIIEKETGRNAVTDEEKQQLADERKIIAGIFYNRLNIGMALQSDATVNFITGKNTPAVSEADTKINSPYNTYLYKGLPPGPICNPSLSSIMAAVYATKSDYFYFLSDPKTGQAIFAKTNDEQAANKQKYLK